MTGILRLPKSLFTQLHTCQQTRSRSCGDAPYSFTKVIFPESESKSAVGSPEPSDGGLHGGQGGKGGDGVDDEPSWPYLRDV